MAPDLTASSIYHLAHLGEGSVRSVITLHKASSISAIMVSL